MPVVPSYKNRISHEITLAVSAKVNRGNPRRCFIFTIFNVFMAPKSALIACIFTLVSSNLLAQEAITPRPSPLAIISMKYKDAYVSLHYSQPHKHGREIFGKLVPYGQVWRTGANEATEITLTRDVLINNQQLKAGTYSLFTIPEQDHWTVIINSETGLWGSYNYNVKLDVLRFDVPLQPVTNVVYEPFTMKFDQKNELANLLMFWDRVSVSVPIKFTN
jgi:hypothetical protein